MIYRRIRARQNKDGSVDVVAYGMGARILWFFVEWALLLAALGAVVWFITTFWVLIVVVAFLLPLVPGIIEARNRRRQGLPATRPARLAAERRQREAAAAAGARAAAMARPQTHTPTLGTRGEGGSAPSPPPFDGR
jgi:hypothetical protein